ncbi:MAG: 23S rRNA (uracil(1939)-C(5))-methyltransferase RlmD, partial [Acutalibacteraceae bacterium]|nr:23S rRNA (uracil(1939)-C(5))-methyltransferase RlmD [Acutalibacteraceae bacterium]
IIPSISIYGYRNKAQYPVSGEGKVGFYAFHSHRIIPCADCSLQPRIFSKIVAVTEDWIKENNISIYEEEKHRGLLRHIYLRLAEVTNEIMFTAVINGDKLPFADRLIDSLKSLCGENLKSVQININKKDTNVILGDKCEVLYGEPYITDVLCGIKVRLSALSFYQVNRTMAEKLYEKAAEYAKPEGRNILDLYCGAGTIGLSMAGSAKSIIGVEIIPEAIADAEFNARNNGISNAEFICGDATTAANDLKKRKIHPDTVIVDPPRKGCTPELIATITNDFSPERVVYVSCDPATLARDIKIFGENGYSLIEYTPVDLFPRTIHVETVALLYQRRPDEHIDITIDLTEFDTTAAELKATYPEIKEYVLNKFGLKVSSLYISQVKTKCGIIERENYNKGKAGHRVPQCPKEKEDAIMDALKHFKMI